MTTTALFFLTDDDLTARRVALLAADHGHRLAAELSLIEGEIAHRADDRETAADLI